MRCSLLAAALAAIAFPAAAGASEWKSIDAGHDEAGRWLIFGDRASIRTKPPGHKLMWIEMVRAHPGKLGDLYTKQLDEIDCAGRRTRALSITAYASSGEVLYSQSAPSAWNDVPPDTFGETERHAACIGFPPSSFASDDPLGDGKMLLGEP